MKYLVAKSLSNKPRRPRRSQKSESNKIAELFSHFRDSLRVISDFGSESWTWIQFNPTWPTPRTQTRFSWLKPWHLFALGAALGARDYCGRRRYSVYRCRCHRSFLFSSRDARPDADLLWPAVHSLCRQGVGFFLVLSVYLQRAADVFGATSIGSSHAQSFFPSASSFTNFSTNASETSSAGFWPHKRPSRFSGFLPPR